MKAILILTQRLVMILRSRAKCYIECWPGECIVKERIVGGRIVGGRIIGNKIVAHTIVH